jgi:hypothetical protein
MEEMTMIKKTKYYEVSILRGTIGTEFDRAGDIEKSRNVIAVKGADLITATTYQYFIAGDVR